jgi:peptidyl-prolyl cis-trans isomerase C
MMKYIVLTSALLLSATAFAQVPVTVNGQTITVQAQKQLITQLEPQLEKQGIKDKEQQRKFVLNNILIPQAVINAEANKQKITSDPLVKIELEARRTQVLQAELLKKNVFNKPLTEKEISAAYEEAKKAYDPNEVKLHHILVKTESEATAAIAQIKGGKPFEEVAKAVSLDKGTAKNGGEIPFTNVRTFGIPGFADAAMALDVGQLRPTPFKSQLGYHVIRLDDKKAVPFPPLDEIKAKIEQLAGQKKAQEYIAGLMKNASVTEGAPKK